MRRNLDGVTRASLAVLVIVVAALLGALTAVGAAQVVRAMPEPSQPPQPTPLATVGPPTVMATPELVWENGQEPSSPLESDPAVQTVRAALIGEAMAMNTGDFTIAQFTDTTVQSVQESAQRSYIAHTVEFYPGPWPFAPVRVESEETEAGEEAYRVFVCFAAESVGSWFIREDGPGGVLHREQGQVQSSLVLRTPDGLVADLDWRVVQPAEACDPSTIPVARFAEQPDAVFPPDGVQREPVRSLPQAPEPPAADEPSTTPQRVLLTTLLVVILVGGLAVVVATVLFAVRAWPRSTPPEPVVEFEDEDAQVGLETEPGASPEASATGDER